MYRSDFMRAMLIHVRIAPWEKAQYRLGDGPRHRSEILRAMLNIVRVAPRKNAQHRLGGNPGKFGCCIVLTATTGYRATYLYKNGGDVQPIQKVHRVRRIAVTLSVVMPEGVNAEEALCLTRNGWNRSVHWWRLPARMTMETWETV